MCTQYVYVVQVLGRAEPHNLTLLHPNQDRVVSVRENARMQVSSISPVPLLSLLRISSSAQHAMVRHGAAILSTCLNALVTCMLLCACMQSGRGMLSYQQDIRQPSRRLRALIAVQPLVSTNQQKCPCVSCIGCSSSGETFKVQQTQGKRMAHAAKLPAGFP